MISTSESCIGTLTSSPVAVDLKLGLYEKCGNHTSSNNVDSRNLKVNPYSFYGEEESIKPDATA